MITSSLSGKVLPDDRTVEACEIREKDFLVLMVSKVIKPVLSVAQVFIESFPQPKPTAASSSTTPAQPVQPAQPILSTQPAQPTTTEPAPNPVEPTTEEPTEPTTTGDSSSGFLTGPALKTATDRMVEMGFPREEVHRAMRASFNNPDRAVEYLMTVSRLSVFITCVHDYLSRSGLGDPCSYSSRASPTTTCPTACPIPSPTTCC